MIGSSGDRNELYLKSEMKSAKSAAELFAGVTKEIRRALTRRWNKETPIPFAGGCCVSVCVFP